MEIHKYTASDTRSAMAQVRAALGPDALILANRRRGGIVEITATRDVAEAVDSPAAREPSAPGRGPGNEVQMMTLQRELQRLRGIIEKELGAASWRESARKPAARAAVLQKLRRLGLSRSLAGEIVDALHGDHLGDLWESALAALARRLVRPAEVRGASEESRITALFGCTGVGKTSAIARLAARDVQLYGADAVGLVSLDNYRVGAQEQLTTFADALGLPLLMADDARGLRTAVDRLRRCRSIYVDSAGMGQNDRRLQRQLHLLDALDEPVRRLVVLSAVAQPSQARALVEGLGSAGLSGAIITKLDESCCLGGVLDVVARAALPVYCITEGQRIPEDLTEVSGAQLVARAVALAERDRAPAGRTGRRLRMAG